MASFMKGWPWIHEGLTMVNYGFPCSTMVIHVWIWLIMDDHGWSSWLWLISVNYRRGCRYGLTMVNNGWPKVTKVDHVSLWLTMVEEVIFNIQSHCDVRQGICHIVTLRSYIYCNLHIGWLMLTCYVPHWLCHNATFINDCVTMWHSSRVMLDCDFTQ